MCEFRWSSFLVVEMAMEPCSSCLAWSGAVETDCGMRSGWRFDPEIHCSRDSNPDVLDGCCSWCTFCHHLHHCRLARMQTWRDHPVQCDSGADLVLLAAPATRSSRSLVQADVFFLCLLLGGCAIAPAGKNGVPKNDDENASHRPCHFDSSESLQSRPCHLDQHTPVDVYMGESL